MRLLLTNDDGVNAKGLITLAKELEKYHDIVIVAPSSQRSACGHSITITEPLIVKEVELEGIKSKIYSVSGTPADCVRIALDKLIDEKVDMVLSGINNGANVGTDVLYSGTVSAAIEASMYKIPSIALSSHIKDGADNYEVAAKYALKILSQIENLGMKNDVVLNINVPLESEEDIKGIKVCKIGNRLYDNYFIEEISEDNHKTYSLGGKINDYDYEDTDIYYLKRGYVTLTPLHYDLTNFKILSDVRNIFSTEH
ncbi:MAG: 5'/3'-nucleotidase SurE [Clostridiaceae bacterium]|nr:5'/3'-nucleotidase SurE [Clostridiaceae bacterium]